MDGFWGPFRDSTDGVMDVSGRDVITELDQRLASLLYNQDVSVHTFPGHPALPSGAIMARTESGSRSSQCFGESTAM